MEGMEIISGWVDIDDLLAAVMCIACGRGQSLGTIVQRSLGESVIAKRFLVMALGRFVDDD